MYDLAVESARESVTGDDTHRMLWNGDRAVAEWSFDGRSGGWLVLDSFDGLEMGAQAVRREGGAYLWSLVESLPFPALRRLYRFVVQCRHDFRAEAIRSEIEHAAAFHLFANVCAKVESDEDEATRLQAAKDESAERAHWEARDTVTA